MDGSSTSETFDVCFYQIVDLDILKILLAYHMLFLHMCSILSFRTFHSVFDGMK